MKNFGCYSPSICFAPEIPPEDKGGGDDDVTGGFTEAQIKAMGAMMNTVMSSHMKRQPSFEDQLKTVKWQDLLAPVVKELVPVSDAKPKDKPEETEYQKQLANLQAQFQAEQKRSLDAENRAKASEVARRNDAGKLKLRSALTGKVQDEALDHVINHLTVVNNRMVVDEDGNTKIRVKRPEFSSYGPLVDVDVPIEDGIKQLLTEPDMKIFIPAPRGSGGSNPGPGGGKSMSSSQFVGEATTDAEKVQRAMVRANELKAKFGLEG